MRIGIEGRTLQERLYGVARYLGNILPHMTSLAPQNEYLLYVSNGAVGPDLPEGVETRAVESGGPALAWRHWKLPAAMKRDGIDVHYSPSYFVPIRKVCPAVPVVHDVSFLAHPEWFTEDRRMRHGGMFWRAVRRCVPVITVSRFSRSEIARCLHIDPAGVRVIHNAADPCFTPYGDGPSASEVMRRYSLRGGFVLTVGAIHTRRNIPRLVEALSASDRDLLVIGAPAPFSPPVDFMGRARELGMEARVKHVEYVPEEDLIALYRACGVFAYPSLYEGFGLPVVEAMACGATVVCSRGSSLPEVAGDAALYFDPYDPVEIAGAVEAACGDPRTRHKLKAKGIEQAASFSWEKSARLTLAALAEAWEG